MGLFQDSHELEDREGPADLQLREVAIQAAPRSGTVACDTARHPCCQGASSLTNRPSFSPDCRQERAVLPHRGPAAALQNVDHVNVSMRVLEVQIERGRIAYADPGKTMLLAPELHTASMIGVKDPHLALPSLIASPQRSLAGLRLRGSCGRSESDRWHGSGFELLA